jgi:hypothetical protein
MLPPYRMSVASRYVAAPASVFLLLTCCLGGHGQASTDALREIRCISPNVVASTRRRSAGSPEEESAPMPQTVMPVTTSPEQPHPEQLA